MRGAVLTHRVLCVAYVAVSAAAYAVALAPSTTRATAYIVLHGVLTVLMLGAWMTANAGDTTRWTLTAGVAARVVLIFAPPFTTHDVDRYLWDGRVALERYDPYRVAPSDPALAALHLHWPTPAEHAAYPTLYPPGALVLFALAANAGPEHARLAWKLMVTSASILTLWPTLQLARARRMTRHLPLVALSPLLVLEGGVGAHVDVVVALAVATAFLMRQRGRWVGLGVALGLGALVKLLPGVAVLPLVAELDPRARTRVVAGTAGVLALGYGLTCLAGYRPIGSLGIFFTKWRGGSPLVAALAALPAGAATLVALVALVGGAMAIGTWAPWLGWLGRAQALFVMTLLASPVVFPWYLAPLIPGLVVAPSAFVLVWATALPLTYEVLRVFDATGVWAPASWPLATVAGCWLVGLAIDVGRSRRATSALVLPTHPSSPQELTATKWRRRCIQ